MSIDDFAYEKPAVTKNGNVREVTFNHVGWSCSLGDCGSDSSSDGDSSSDSSS